MTSNERRILKCLWDGEGRMHIQVIAQKTGVSSDYARLLCSSLERGEYLKFADINVCYLLTRGRNRFQDIGPIVETAEVEISESDATVNPEIIVETVSAGVSEKDEQSSEDETQDADLDNDEEEITDSDEKMFDEKNGEEKKKEELDKIIAELDQSDKEEAILEPIAPEELESTDEESSEAGDEKLVEEIKNEILKEEARVEELASDQGQDTEETKENIEENDEEEKQETEVEQGKSPESEEDILKNLKDASDDEKEKLANAGYKTVEDLAEAPVNRLIQSIGVNLKKAANWINQARRQTGAIDDKKVESKK